MLPADHWLAGEVLFCTECYRPLYDESLGGTQNTWVETGAVALEHVATGPTDGHNIWEPQAMDLNCFAARENDVFPTMDDKWALNDDGTPQSALTNFAAPDVVVSTLPDNPYDPDVLRDQ